MSVLGNNLFAAYYAQQGLPDGYRRVEYIEATGTQWIDTGYIGNQDTKIKAKLKTKNANYQYVEGLFGSRIYTTNVSRAIYMYDLGYESYWGGQRYQIAYNSKSYNINNSYHNVIDVFLNKNIIYVNNVIVNTFTEGTFTNPSSILLFSCHTGANGQDVDNRCANARIYDSFKIYDDIQLARNFIPCVRLSDNKSGMYDLCGSICPLTNTPFYVNAGTGEFVIPT